jgi:hypothetical protein
VQAAAGAAVAIALGTLGLASACSRAEGRTHRCDCRFLTDWDDPSERSVEVCAAEDGEVQDRARGCAQSASPGPVESCRCSPVASAPACEPGACRALE